MNEKNGTIKDARTLGIPRMLLLGLQHQEQNILSYIF